MKLNSSRSRTARCYGSTLTVTLLTAVVASIVLASMLSLAMQQRRAAARSLAWNAAMPVAEAGIEEALTHLERNGAGSMFINGWEAKGSDAVIERDLGTSRLAVRISPGNKPVIVSRGFVRAPFGMRDVVRAVEVRAVRRPTFPKALFGIEGLTLGGNFLADSFDSGDEAYSVGGAYDPSRRKDNGNLATNGRADLAVEAGANARVYGRADTGPGGVLEVKGASVGSLDWVNAATPGVEPGRSVSDVSVSFPEVELPFAGGAFIPQSEVVSGVKYKYVLHSGKYQLSTLKLAGDDTVLVQGDATLLVDQDVTTTGNGTIIVRPDASLQLYVKSGLVKLGGNAVLNQAGKAEDFGLFGLPALQAIKIAGNGSLVGTIYAPGAQLTLVGGGTDPLDFVGAALAKSITTTGHFQTHYDEALDRHEDSLFVITSWREI